MPRRSTSASPASPNPLHQLTLPAPRRIAETLPEDILAKLHAPPKPAYPILAPGDLAQFDAFPKLPSTYKTRSESRGFLTIFVVIFGLLLVLNDLGEFIWGWPDYEFGVDIDPSNKLDINVDMVVNMPCQCEPFFPASFLVYTGGKGSRDMDHAVRRVRSMSEYMRPVTADGGREAHATFTGCGEGRNGSAQLLHPSFGTACRLEYPPRKPFLLRWTAW